MSHLEKLNGEFRNLLVGVEQARGLAAAADSRAQEVGRRAAGAGFTAVAAETQRVVLNLEDWNGDLVALQKQFDDWPVPGLKELVAVQRSGVIVQIVRRN
jgi:hypothetical protein